MLTLHGVPLNVVSVQDSRIMHWHCRSGRLGWDGRPEVLLLVCLRSRVAVKVSRRGGAPLRWCRRIGSLASVCGPAKSHYTEARMGWEHDTHLDCSYSLIFAFTRDTMELNVRFPLSAICPIVRWKSWN